MKIRMKKLFNYVAITVLATTLISCEDIFTDRDDRFDSATFVFESTSSLDLLEVADVEFTITDSQGKVITEKIEIEVKKIVKEKFDYEIPIAEIQKAGISSTGAEIDNELIPLAKEFTPYRVENKLWSVPIKSVKYRIDEDGNTFRFRMTDNIVSESEPVYMIKK